MVKLVKEAKSLGTAQFYFYLLTIMSDEAFTTNERDGEKLPGKKLLAYLQRHALFPPDSSHLTIHQFANGFSNLTYLLTAGSQNWVLRRPPKGAVKRGHDMGREFKVLSSLYRVFPKAPRAYHFCADTDIIGAPFYLMEEVEGIILTSSEVKKRKISDQDFRKISQTWLDAFVELHQTDYHAASLGDLGRPHGYVARQVMNWGKQYLKAKTEEIDAATPVMTWLEDHQPTEYGHSLIHNDYKYNNVVFADDQWSTIRAVLDWEMCTIGDPLMDLGTTLSYWLVDDDDELLMKVLAESTTTYPGNFSREELVHQYALKTGTQVNHLIFYYSFGLFKLAVIVQQIFFRYHLGHTSDPRFAHLNLATRALIEMAWRAIQRQRI